MYQLLRNICWAVASFWGMLALANFETPAIATTFIIWALLFLPPLYQKTQIYKLDKNILWRVVIFIFAPIVIPIVMSVNMP
ncbi:MULTISPECIES: hypothetical protein [Nostocales]|uniref:Uncharacterized protein n=3 Tax=Nostocales TaxID=1161 RepID=A0A0C1N7J8_9CYAN|nr:hypothetical protein [Tolypothrix bouteillei]KAF3883864.1 hypothetical protein DA73_0400039855 [Tolypothrix bouteillei VB521301]